MRKYINWLWLLVLITSPIVLLCLPSDYFDSEDGIIVCPSRLFFNVECPGCGMTRAMMHFIHLEFEEAVYFNMLSLVVMPLLGFIWVKWVIDTMKELGLWQKLFPSSK